ncbi:hypothetical protein FNV43_RR03338 [Rhamnella rubrinervis]|uniref:DNA-directed RNA polymerase n=1 Tax=Rhamnella rubrinervis TaxID=2594499 RepID=A0A8K0HIA4_9ROSA|nr:hypothetical protein FNV43_RR03338 [Rhamnella rubrinervis]
MSSILFNFRVWFWSGGRSRDRRFRHPTYRDINKCYFHGRAKTEDVKPHDMGEAANVRLLPECLCYIFHHVLLMRMDQYVKLHWGQGMSWLNIMQRLGWVLGCRRELHKQSQHPVPLLAILPLGTENALSRCSVCNEDQDENLLSKRSDDSLDQIAIVSLSLNVVEFCYGTSKSHSCLNYNDVRGIIHLANSHAGGVEKRSYDGRLAFVDNHINDIFDSANNPVNGNRWCLSAEDPFQIHDIMIRDSNKDPASNPNALLAKVLTNQVGWPYLFGDSVR